MINYFKKFFTVFVIVTLLSTTLTWGIFKKSSKITVTGSTTVLPIAQACAEYYMKNKNKKAEITVSGGGSSVGIAAVLDGRADIGDASRNAKSKEINAAKEKGIDLYKNVVALDSVVVVVHPDIPLTKLTRDKLADVYSGKISNWSDLGGPNAEIVVISRDTSSGTYECFHEYGIKKAKVRADAQMVASNQAMATTVAQTPNSIGYVGLGYLKSADIKPINIDGIEANMETTKDGTYPISRTLNMYTNGKPKGEIAKFINFIQSATGQKIVEEQGYIQL
jgi:phosphate transport system substrate-binding protein